ncbi:MAG TPA: DUF4294 domain-containing protein [Bacteroidia bacterium]|nr:DUF4294 domain-containing protein [Bacteroidia bacterium]
MKDIFCIIILFFIFFDSDGQDSSGKNSFNTNIHPTTTDSLVNQKKRAGITTGTTVMAKVIDGDTLAIITLKEFSVYSPRVFKTEKEANKYGRLLRDVKAAYPYSKIASEKLKEYNTALKGFKTERERKEFLKVAEIQMKAEFENDLKNLTIRQGRILIKLIDRETGNSSYDLVKDLKGTFSAFMWQSIARLFGSSLKDRYNADEDDKMIEEIIILIEKGDV